MSGHIEPFPSVMTGWWVQSRRAADFQRLREEARRWRLSVPMTYYRAIRRQFEDAGLRIYFYNVNFNETFTDEERDRTFEAARELGAEGFSSSTVLSEARRLVPFVERHRMFVAMHNHNNLADPDQFATPASFETALAMSPLFRRHARHRSLHGGQQRRRGVHPAAPCGHREHSRARSKAEQRAEPAVRAGRHAYSRGPSAHSRREIPDTVLPRVRIRIVPLSARRGEGVLSGTAKTRSPERRWTARHRRAGHRCSRRDGAGTRRRRISGADHGPRARPRRVRPEPLSLLPRSGPHARDDGRGEPDAVGARGRGHGRQRHRPDRQGRPPELADGDAELHASSQTARSWIWRATFTICGSRLDIANSSRPRQPYVGRRRRRTSVLFERCQLRLVSFGDRRSWQG